MGIDKTGQLARLESLIGGSAVAMLRGRHVMVVGLGGVGGACAEALARSGIGRLTLIDHDDVTLSNLNRQIVATHDTLGRPKAIAMHERIAAIDPTIEVVPMIRRLVPDEVPEVLLHAAPDAVIDAVDDIPVKIALALCTSGCYRIASMGMGNRLDPTQVRIGDFFEVTHDPLARAIRRRLRAAGVERLRVAYSLEPPQRVQKAPQPADEARSASAPASSAFVPNAAGLALAYDVVRCFLNGEGRGIL